MSMCVFLVIPHTHPSLLRRLQSLHPCTYYSCFLVFGVPNTNTCAPHVPRLRCWGTQSAGGNPSTHRALGLLHPSATWRLPLPVENARRSSRRRKITPWQSFPASSKNGQKSKPIETYLVFAELLPFRICSPILPQNRRRRRPPSQHRLPSRIRRPIRLRGHIHRLIRLRGVVLVVIHHGLVGLFRSTSRCAGVPRLGPWKSMVGMEPFSIWGAERSKQEATNGAPLASRHRTEHFSQQTKENITQREARGPGTRPGSCKAGGPER